MSVFGLNSRSRLRRHLLITQDVHSVVEVLFRRAICCGWIASGVCFWHSEHAIFWLTCLVRENFGVLFFIFCDLKRVNLYFLNNSKATLKHSENFVY